jgi:hypothetical protein
MITISTIHRVFLLAWLIPCTCSTLLMAGPEAPVEDLKLGRLAYTTLRGTELGEANIAVRVLRGGTAILWGPAPSMEAIKKAEEKLLKIDGIKKVVNQCDLVGTPDPLIKQVDTSLRTKRPVEEEVPKEKTPQQEEIPVKSVEPTRPFPIPAKEEGTRSAPPPPAASVSRHTTAEKPETEGKPAARLLDPSEVSTQINYATIEKIRRGDNRFEKLKMDLRDERIIISGHVGNPNDAWRFARLIIPHVGDRDVVVGKLFAR